MAFMNQEKKKELAPAIKSVLKKYGLKGSIRVENYSALVVTLKSGSLKFNTFGRNYLQMFVDHSCTEQPEKAQEFIKELNIAMNRGNHDNSDMMTDYFDVGWYSKLNIGDWDKPYQYIKDGVLQTPPFKI
tara:strand:- start:24788 stop:25177 length:390 start_codon:yes stop_codon:yes gene_type:complete